MQELWIERHKNEFDNCVVMGVGGAFDYLSGNIVRSPVLIQKIGGEWLYRLIIQPWRWRRQLRLLKFIGLIFQEKMEKNKYRSSNTSHFLLITLRLRKFTPFYKLRLVKTSSILS